MYDITSKFVRVMFRSKLLPRRIIAIFNNNSNIKAQCYSTCTRRKFYPDHNLNSNLAGYAQKTSLRCWKCGVERKNAADYFCEHCSVIQSPHDAQNYFKVFDLEENFDLDAGALRQKYRKMQSLLHPDKFSNSTDMEKQISEEYSSLVNKAYGTLQTPLNRAVHLLQLHNEGIDEDDKGTNAEFLLEMMELNEAIDEAVSVDEIKSLHAKNKAKLGEIIREISAHFKNGNIDKAKESILKMKYYNRIDRRLGDIMREKGILD